MMSRAFTPLAGGSVVASRHHPSALVAKKRPPRLPPALRGGSRAVTLYEKSESLGRLRAAVARSRPAGGRSHPTAQLGENQIDFVRLFILLGRCTLDEPPIDSRQR